jgi:hypothetical protein
MRNTIRTAGILLVAALIGGAGAASLLAAQAATADQAQAQTEKEKAQQFRQDQEKLLQEMMQKKKAEDLANEPVVKTYTLKYISATEFMRSARFYVLDSTGTDATLTVKIMRKSIPDFEALLKKLDVEKKNIQFQIYTIIAAKEDQLPKAYEEFAKIETKEITDKDLKRVLDEMKGLWNFKHYWIDSPSFLIAKDGSGSNRSKLVSRYDLELILRSIQLRGEEAGKRIVSVGEIALVQKRGENIVDSLINTSDITLKEKGYLVVGVSGMSGSVYGMSLALILVISAEIK